MRTTLRHRTSRLVAGLAALLTPQGKILFDFFVLKVSEERFAVDCAASQKAELMKRLGFYKLRAKVAVSYGTEAAGVSMTEPAAGSDLQGVRTTAVRGGSDWVSGSSPRRRHWRRCSRSCRGPATS